MIRLPAPAILAAMLMGTACKDDAGNSSNSSRAEVASTSAEVPAEVAVVGTLALGSNVNNSPIPADQTAFLASQSVQVLTAENEILAQATTSPTGAFTLAVTTEGLGLADTATVNRGPRVFTLVGVVKRDWDGKVQGTRKTLILDGKGESTSAAGVSQIETGVQKTRGVGAIRGKLRLEGGAAPVGTDVYVPGTSYVAKTDDQGEFVLAFISPGTYTVRADRAGYGSAVLDNVTVARSDTRELPAFELPISTGPQILSFGLDGGATSTTVPVIHINLVTKGAIKYKVSMSADFRGALYQSIDLFASPFGFDFPLTGGDGDKRVYVRIADQDGAETDASFDVRLDTSIPEAPVFAVLTTNLATLTGFAGAPLILVKPAHCNDVDLIYVAESAATPSAAQFVTACADALADGTELTLSAADGDKTLHLWAIDRIGQISATPSVANVTLDSVAPTVTVTPASGVSAKSIQVGATASESARLFYTIDGSDPTASSPPFVDGLVLIGNATFKIRAIDRAGNSSAVVERAYTIDPDSPILGSIVIAGNALLTRQQTVSVNVNAIGATNVMLSEDRSFVGAQWQSYASNVSYTFATNANGVKTIYARFKDDAGNILGVNGELKDDIEFDSLAPTSAGITLFFPETPSGAFDKILLWSDVLRTTGTRYEVEVHENASYTGLVRSGISSDSGETAWRVNPPFSAPGTFYWRLRTIDDAGNRSAWIEGGSEKRFTIKLYKEAYLPTAAFAEAPRVKSQYFGYRATAIDEAAGRYLVSTLRGEVASGPLACDDCGIVDLLDVDDGSVIQTFTDRTSFQSGFGDRAVPCDLNNDNVDDIVISAPFAFLDIGGNRYHNAGRVYAYDGATYAPLLTYDVNPTNGVYYCGTQVAAGDTCHEFGYPNWPTIDYPSQASRDRQYTGQGLDCVRRVGADMLAIGSPGWTNASAETRGRVDFIEYTSGGTNYAPVGSALVGNVGATEWEFDRFGAQVAYLPRFKAGAFDGPAVAIAAPGRAGGGSQRGAVIIYSLAGTAIATISEPTNTNYNNYGRSIFPLGNLNAFEDANGYTELAIAGQSVVRIYSGEWPSTTPVVSKSVKRQSNSYSFGAQVASLGDLTGDGKPEIGIADLSYAASGYWGVGRVEVFDYDALDAIDASTQEEKVDRRLVGKVASYQYTGSALFRGKDLDNDDVIDTIVLGSPGDKGGKGSISVYSPVSVSPGIPDALAGLSANERFGHRVVSAGDFDADGTTDFVVSAPNVNYVYAKVGRIYIISGADRRILHQINGRAENQRFGVATAFVESSLIVTDAHGNVYRFDREAVLGVTDINAYAPGSNSAYAYSRRSGIGYGEIGIAGEAMTVGQPYSPDHSDRKILVHSAADLSTDVVTGSYVGYHGLAVIYDRYLYSSKSLGECRSAASSPDSSCKCTAFGTEAGEEFGASAAFVPDLNGDGRVDFAVGAPGRDNGDGTTGAIYVFDGARCQNYKAFTDTEAMMVITPKTWDAAATTNRFGSSLTGFVDIDGAGSANGTLLVTNQSTSRTEATSEGELFGVSHTRKRAKLVNASATIFALDEGVAGNAINVRMTVTGAVGDVYTSTCSASGNDLTFVLGKCPSCNPAAPVYASGYNLMEAVRNDAGCAAKVVVVETPGVYGYLSEITSFTALSGGADGAPHLYAHLKMPAGTLFGANVLNIGDQNRDGWPDLAVASPKARGLTASDGGQVTLYSSFALLRQTNDASYPANAEMIKFYSPTGSFSNFGSSIFTGDVSGDGIEDFVIGAGLFSSANQSEVGAAYVYQVKGVNAEDL